jgi:DNA primase catalytic core
MRIKNFEETTKKLQPYLIEYLQNKGIDTSKNFSCLHPDHNDGNPSMSLVRPENIRVYCHGCGATGDLFDVAHFLEDKPVAGPAFATETLDYLADMFGIEVEHDELTEEEVYELDTYRAYKYAYEHIVNWSDPPPAIKAEFEKRGWDNHNRLRELGLGFVPDAKAFREYLKKKGFAASFLDDIDLGRKEIFADGNLVYTIKDEYGRPVGFAARNLSDSGAKFVNQKTTGVKCNIYQKRRRLYGLDIAIKHRHEGPLYIVEGYSDVITPHLNGHKNIAATCGTALTDDHLLLLKEKGIYNIVLCYDGDDAGQDRTKTLLDTKFANHREIMVKVVDIPDGQDPDEYIREHGVEAFLALKQWSSFQWRLNRFDEEEDPEHIAKTMMPHIVSEPSRISQEKMLHDLAQYTGFTLKTLQEELFRLMNTKDEEKAKERNTIVDRMVADIRRSPEDIEAIMAEAQAKLHSHRSKYDEDNFSEQATLRFLADLKIEEEGKTGEYQGFVLGPDLAEFQEALTGEWRKDIMAVFGGKANSGKTSFLCKLGFEIANHVEENNAVVIYHTIDDSAEQLFPKVLCVAEGSTQLEINHVKNPNYYKTHGAIDYEDMRVRREEGYRKMLELVRTGRFVIKDSNDGMSIGYADALIKYYQDKYPDRQIVYILDNFHKLRDFEHLGDERTRFKLMSTIIKNMAVRHHIPIFCTMEYTKLQPGEKPTNNNIAETVQMEYDANLIAHIWNGVHDLGDRADERHFHTVMRNGEPQSMPIVEMNIGKNKISSFKSKLYFKFFPAASDFREQPHAIQLALENSMDQRSRPSAGAVASIKDGLFSE